MEFTPQEKKMILSNEKDYPSLAKLIKDQNKFRFDNEEIKQEG